MRTPTEFKAEKGSNQQLYKLRRAKAETGAPKKDTPTPKGDAAKEAEQQKEKEDRLLRRQQLFQDAAKEAEQQKRQPPAKKSKQEEPKPKPTDSSLATTIRIGDVSYTLPFAFPSGEEILRALPAKVRPKNAHIQGELLGYCLDAPKNYAAVGRARLAQAQFKCTVFTDSGSEVVYIDRDHLVVEK